MGYVHHDLKLENILVKVNSKGDITDVKISDFGFARSTSEKLVAGQDSHGTFQYAAPEMLIKGQ